MHMNHDHMPDGMMFQSAPEWLISSLGVLFLVFSLFYWFRLLRPNMVKSAIGFFDWEGEAGHAICMLAMASSLAFWLVPISAVVWSWVLGFGTVYYALRALTWGRRLAFNKQWWDWTHSGMYLGMFLMYQTLPIGAFANGVLNGLMMVFWLWFSLLYIRDSYIDMRAGKALSLGSDIAHLGMGLGMLVMSLFPGYLMTHSHDMNGMMHIPESSICSTPSPATSSSVVMVSDVTFGPEVLASAKPVVVLVFGGCENCASEIPVFEKVASDYAGQAKFVVVNKDSAKDVCKAHHIENCPTLVVFKNGVEQKDRLDSQVGEVALRNFIDQALSKP